MHRRRFVRTVGVAATVGLAGCFGGNDSDTEPGKPIEEHPAAADLEEQPYLGNLDGHVILEFGDPSCGSCRHFHEGTVPDIRENLVETGKGAYVTRLRPIIMPWGEDASKALAAVHDRDEDTYWTLLDHYFAEQGSFSTDDVLSRTATFLSSETDLDGDAVVDDVEAGTYDEEIQTNLDVANDAGLKTVSPVILLFRDGEYVTTVYGGSWDTIGGALGEA